MPQRNRKSEQIRRANRVIQSRSFILMLVMGVLLFVVLFFKLYQLQIGRHDELQKKAINQQVRSTVVTASRGTIYDASGNILAISSTAETVFLDPNAIDKALSDTEKPVAWTRELIAQRLGEILGISEDSILEKMERTYSQYEVLKLRVDEDVANEVRSFINEYSVKGIYLSPDAKRYYPYGTLASQVIGFVGTDNTGLYGLEAQYEDQLEGQTGLVVTARDNAGNDLLYEYEQYHAAQNGSNLVLTLDATVQYYLEKGIEEMLDQFDAKNGATGIVMNAKTGGILAMASYPNYDLNDASTVQDARLRAAITPRTKAIVFNNPTNPTGMGYDSRTLDLLARVAQEHDLLIAADEIYTTYLYEGDFRPIRTLPGMAERTITLNSFSKNFLMTGWRVGVIIAEPELLAVMNRINGSLIYSAPSVSQRAAIQALAMRKEIREKYVTAYRDRIFYAADRIEKLPYLSLVRPKGTFYLFPGVEKTGLDEKAFCKVLLDQAHVLVSPGTPFGVSAAGHFRIACTVGIDRLKAAFDRMEKLSF